MNQRGLAIALLCSFFIRTNTQGQDLWDLANRNRDALRVATLFTAQDVRDRLSSDEGVGRAIDWCRRTGVTHAFVESFRDGYTARKEALEAARDRLRNAGFDVSGCVTTTGVGKKSTGWESATCFTDEPTQKRLQEIFEYAASVFDEIMIDDFLFTDCECDACRRARGDLSWSAYRAKLMIDVSRDRILAPARAVNPNVKIIIKYPQWYDDFHHRGYEVVQQTTDYDRIWVGTETRDYADPRWGGKVQYEAYFIMRWLGQIGGPKCGGGWFDPFGTHEDTYVEQARQTVLAEAREMLLFCYGALQRGTGPANIARLRTELPGLFELARLVRDKPLRGIAAPKPPDSDALGEAYVYDFVGMLGLPLAPTATLDTDAQAAFLPAHALKDPLLSGKLSALLDAGAPVLVTDGLAQRLTTRAAGRDNLIVLKVNGNPKGLLELTQQDLKPIRDEMLAPFGMHFDAPNKVALFLIGDDCIVVENFNDSTVTAVLGFARPVEAKAAIVLPVDGEAEFSATPGKVEFRALAARTLVALTLSGGDEGQ